LPLPLFPQPQRFLHGVHFGLQTAALDGAPGESLLIWRELYIHGFKIRETQRRGNGLKTALVAQIVRRTWVLVRFRCRWQANYPEVSRNQAKAAEKVGP
jgi:hypothetical protein